MRSAALLPTPGDPYQLLYWLRNCERVWRDEVDELHVLVSGQPYAPARAAIQDAVRALDGHCYIHDELVPHGPALRLLLEHVDADLVVLMEDDALVRERAELASHLASIEHDVFDVVASPRQSMSPELHDAAQARWGRRLCADGSGGYGMWPAFVFAKRRTLLGTDRDFGPAAWGAGMLVPGLDYKPREYVVADAFGSTAFQLRGADLRIRDLPQWKGPWDWQRFLDAGADIAWFHIGSLSSSGNLIAHEPTLADDRLLTDPLELGEWAHRIHWWGRFVRSAGDALPQQQQRYLENLERLRCRMGVDQARIDAWEPIIARLVTWNEQP